MAYLHKRATPADLELLVSTRLTVLRRANGLPETADLGEALARRTREYYRRALADGSHVAYLVWAGDTVVGAGGISFFQVLPTVSVPSGDKAYIMNMYTAPGHRGRGLAARTLELLVQAAEARGVTAISLEATPMGRPLYQRYGFLPMENEMELPPLRFATRSSLVFPSFSCYNK